MATTTKKAKSVKSTDKKTTKKCQVKEGVKEDIAAMKTLKRKTRKVLKDPKKAGEVADELSGKTIVSTPEAPDAPDVVKKDDGVETTVATAEKKDDVVDTTKKDDVVEEPKADVPATDDGKKVDGDGVVDADSDVEPESHPDLGTFLETAIKNSKEAVVKYQEHLAALKERIKDMGVNVPGLMDPEDFEGEQTPEEFPKDGDQGDSNDVPEPPKKDEGGEEVGGDEPKPNGEGEIATPAKTEGTELK